MQNNHSALWQKCLQIIKRSIGDAPYRTWFADTISLGFKDNELRIHVPSPFTAEHIDKEYINVVGKAINEIYGRGVNLFYHYNIAKNEESSAIDIKSTPEKKTYETSPEIIISNPFSARKLKDVDPQLNPRYSFDNYCRSESNKIAVAIAEAVAQNPQNLQFNPLFIFGPTGVGKTHLIQAIGLSIKEKLPENRVLYVTARTFMAQYTSAVAKEQVNMFFNFYQSIHTLIVDDVQDLNGKKATQNTFYHIFNHLYLNNRRIVLSCDRAPSEMIGLEESLLGRFKCGMTVALDKPDVALRREFLSMRAKQDGIVLSDDILDYIATNVTESVRELEGVMMSLVAHATILNRPISIELGRLVVQNAIKIHRKKVNFEIIVREVSSFFNIEPDALFTKSRKREISDARQIVMYLSKKMLEMPLTSIGRKLGRSHATVIYAINSVEERINVDKKFSREIDRLEKEIINS